MTFDDYKARVSIIQVAEDLGYKQDIRDGKASPVYKLNDKDGNKIDEIIIKNPGSLQEHYFDRNYKGGDLIQFIKNHINDFTRFQHSNMFVRLNMILSHYANTPYTPKYETYTQNGEQKAEFDKARYKVHQPALGELSYLTKERNISPQTVNTFLPFIVKVQDTKIKGNYQNIGFPYINPLDPDKNVSNYELRNYNFKGMATGGDKSNSLWVADFSSRPNLAKHIYFAESALDAMSFYELNKTKIDLERSVFCSVGGYISTNQISNALAKYANANVHTIFDNDLNGKLYDIKVHNIMANTPVEIKQDNDRVNFKLKSGEEFSIHKEEVSLENFRKNARFSAPLIVHKTEGAKDFNEILMKNKDIKKGLAL